MIANLKNLNKNELLKIAAQHGCLVDKRHSEDTIIQEIISKVEAKPMRSKEIKESVEILEPQYSSVDEVESAIAHIKERAPEFKATYDENDRTVHFKCRGAEECHNLSVPLKKLVARAEVVSRGAISLRVRPEFERGAYKGYADTVLA